MKKLFLFSLFLVFALFAENSLAIEGFDSIHTSNYANKQLQYYYHIPDHIYKNTTSFSVFDARRKFPFLIMVPGLSGRGEMFVNQLVKDFAKQEEFIIIAPSFVWDKDNWEERKSYQYPSVWSGKALLDIIRKFKADNKLEEQGLYLMGHSAGAQFVLRFGLWKPEICDAVAAHASGGRIKPDKYFDVKFFVTVGNKDTDQRKNNAEIFYNMARQEKTDVIYKQYDTAHNMRTEQFVDSFDFFKQAYEKKYGKKEKNDKSDKSDKNDKNDKKEEMPSLDQEEDIEIKRQYDTLELKNGRTLDGIITKETKNKVVLQLGEGRSIGTITFPKKAIKNIIYKDK